MNNKYTLNVGDQFGKLKLLKLDHIDENYQKFWQCICNCNRLVVVRQGTLLRKNGTKSCGCLRIGHPGQYLAKREAWEIVARKIYKKRYSDGNLTFNKFVELSQLPCTYCGTVLSNKFNPYMTKDNLPRIDQTVSERRRNETWWSYNGVDRINNSKPHDEENCVTCCKLCNRMKSNLSREIFIQHCRKVIEYG